MNFMEFACRGIVRNEDNICRLHKSMTKLTKIVRDTNGIMFCMCLAGVMLGSVIYANAKDIELLQKQVKDLNRRLDAQEELKEQKGA